MDKMAYIIFKINSLFCCYSIKTPLLAHLRLYKKVKPLIATNHKHRGFTLIELMVTLCALAIMLTIAIPSFRTIILNNRINTSADSLVSTLNYARGIALNNNGNVGVCPFNAQNSTACGSDWSVGWIVVTQPSVGAGILLKSQENGTAGPNITANNNTITFDARGLASSQTNFSLCDTRGSNFARSIEVMTTGYIQSGDTPGRAVWNNNTIACP